MQKLFHARKMEDVSQIAKQTNKKKNQFGFYEGKIA